MKLPLTILVPVLTALFIIRRASAQPAADEVTALPGVTGPLASRQYSGYLSASGTKMLHYWFVESERDPTNDPLLLWMNGGPGCSSLDGYLTELGPYQINLDGKTLSKNNYTWAKVANVIFLEAPAGVGFSYATDKNTTTDDDQTAKNNYLALLDFFVKFPNMADKPFFITGESYAGVYVPTLSVRVMANSSINFQGFAIGNGLLDTDLNTQTQIIYSYYHGMTGEATWAELQKSCCRNGTCMFSPARDLECKLQVSLAIMKTMESGINPYDVTGDNCGGPGGKARRQPRLGAYYRYFNMFQPSDLSLTSKPPPDETFVQPCLQDGPETTYLNTDQVRQALHIPSSVQKWQECGGVRYTMQYKNMRAQFLSLLPKYRGLVYNGDADMICNFLGDQKFVASLGRMEKGGKRAWISNNQVAGFVTEYHQVTFMTVKDAGHMVPSFSPGQSLQMISNFLDNKPQ